MVLHDARGDVSDKSAGVLIVDLLREDLLAGELISGSVATTQPVRWLVPSSTTDQHELRDAAVWVGPDAARDEIAAKVRRLAECGASLMLLSPAVSAETRRTLVAAAPSGLPIYLLTRTTSYREVSELVATKILAERTHVLEYRMHIHRELGHIFARGDGLEALTRAMARLSNGNVFILSSAGDIQAQAAPTGMTTHVTEVVERAFQQVQAHQSANAGSRDPILIEEQSTRGIAVGLHDAGNRLAGVLLIIPVDRKDCPHAHRQRLLIAEEGAHLIHSERLRLRAAQDAAERARNDFVQALLHARFSDHVELAARAEHYQFDLAGQYAVLIIETPELQPYLDRAALVRSKILGLLQHQAGETPLLTANIGSMLVAIRTLSADEGPTEVLESMTTELGRTVPRAYPKAIVAIGNVHTGAAGVARSYRQARTTLELSKRTGLTGVSTFSALRVYAALRDSALGEAGREFASEMLAPLRDSGAQHAELEEVVRTYIEESGNLNATARRLHFHRNTLLYKLDRASELLGLNLRQSEAQFMFWLALHFDALSQVHYGLEQELNPLR